MAINIGKNSDGDVTYDNPPIERVLFPNITEYATPEAIEAFVNAWLDDHPEATTTVEDASILPVKLDSTNEATDGYVLSYNATAGKFEWYDIGGELDDINSDITDLKQDFDQFPNGNYPNMTTGNAEQLVSTVFVEDEVPYNFRTSGGSADIGDRGYDEIVGVSMAINQVCNFPDVSNTSTTDTRTTLQFIIMTRRPTSTNFLVKNIANVGLFEAVIAITEDHTGFDFKHNGSTNDIWFGRNDTYPLVGGHKYFASVYFAKIDPTTIEGLSAKNMMFMDLTLLLGTQIADYVYGLETATAGSGITWLKHHFPKIFDSGYIPYNAGEMQSVSGLSLHRMTGFNQFNGVWNESKYLKPDGTLGDASSSYATTDYIHVIPGATYYGRIEQSQLDSVNYAYYDINKNTIVMQSSTYDFVNRTFVVPDNAYYLRITVNKTRSFEDNFNINLHWDGERDGQYEAYKEYVYPLDDSVVLRGKLELDSNNNLRANGDRYLPDGTIQRNWAEVDLGDLTWEQLDSENSSYFYSRGFDNLIKENPDIICSKYNVVASVVGNSNILAVTYTGIIIKKATIAGNPINIHDPAYTSASAFKTAMSGVKLIYQLATPTTETAEPYQTPQIDDDWGTEEYVSTSLVPVGHYTKYAPNLRAKLEMAPESPAGNGDYIVCQTNGENEYVALGSTTTIQNILDRLTALENA